MFGEISNADGTWPSITPREVRRAFEASVSDAVQTFAEIMPTLIHQSMVYANISSDELGFPGKPKMIWAPARADVCISSAPFLCDWMLILFDSAVACQRIYDSGAHHGGPQASSYQIREVRLAVSPEICRWSPFSR